jgi:hypothetical protein
MILLEIIFATKELRATSPPEVEGCGTSCQWRMIRHILWFFLFCFFFIFTVWFFFLSKFEICNILEFCCFFLFINCLSSGYSCRTFNVWVRVMMLNAITCLCFHLMLPYYKHCTNKMFYKQMFIKQKLD